MKNKNNFIIGDPVSVLNDTMTGEIIKIKGKNVVKFATGKKLQDAI